MSTPSKHGQCAFCERPAIASIASHDFADTRLNMCERHITLQIAALRIKYAWAGLAVALVEAWTPKRWRKNTTTTTTTEGDT